MFSSLLFMALAAVQPQDAVQRVDLTDQGRAISATYSPITTLEKRAFGAVSVAHGRHARCRWSAAITVERRLEGEDGNAAVRQLSPVLSLGGVAPTRCANSDAWIDRQIALHAPAVAAHVASVAQADRALLREELGLTDRAVSQTR